MKKFVVSLVALLAVTGGAQAASITNADQQVQELTVTEGGSQETLQLSPGDTVEFCPTGCFVTMPSGDREALTGAETIDIVGGKAVYK
jgi:plastocyanin